MLEKDKKIIDECLLYKNDIYNFIYKMTYNEILSEEILQETYLKVIKNIGQFEGRSQVKTWIIAIAKNEVFKYIKNQKKDIKALEQIRRIENTKSIGIEYTQYEYRDYMDQIKNGCLFALLKCLPFKQRCVFILHSLNNISLKAVSGILGKSENATRILLFRAKSTIRSFLCDNCEHISCNPKCKCQNMINFSIKNNLIKEIKKDNQVNMAKAELRKFKDEIELFNSISDKEISEINFNDTKYKNIFKKK